MFGERNEANNLHGRGIYFHPFGTITIGYWNHGEYAPGNYITIWDGGVDVGECYLKDGEKRIRGTSYKKNGTTEKFDDWLITLQNLI